MTTAMQSGKSVGKVVPERTALFICDLQDKFKDVILHFKEIVQVSARMAKAAAILNMPVIVTEQYPKGLGHSVSELGLDSVVYKQVHEKTCFTMCLPEVLDFLETHNIRSVAVCGIETHVCVLQTCLDLIEKGYDVHVLADATSSRVQVDRVCAYRRMENAGAFLTTSESLLFLLMRDSLHPNFKAVQALIKEPAPDTGLTCTF